MQLFDMHCDTLYRAYTENSTLFDDSFHISFGKADYIRPYIQCLAIWIPDEYRGEAAWELFCGCLEKMKQQISGRDIVLCRTAEDISYVRDNKKQGIILTVEGGAVLGGDPGKIQRLHDEGVRMMTLTWNGSNELGDGIMAPENRGLTELGKAAVREMERAGIIVDISHGGEKLFEDTAQIAQRPFVASHSNVRAVTPHPRNLTDEQFKRLVSAGGLAGLNFCKDFLVQKNDRGEILQQPGMYDIINHAGYMLSLGGAGSIAIGADFDGADIPEDIDGIGSMGRLRRLFEERFGSEITEDIFFGNAYRFFTENIR